MKKLMIGILVLVCLLTSSCERKQPIQSNSVRISDPQPIELETYSFNGHSYVGNYTTFSDDGRSNFLVHDPDCKLCKERNQTKDNE